MSKVRLLTVFAILLANSVELHAATLTAFASMVDVFGTAPNVTDAPPPLTVNTVLFGQAPTLGAEARDPETGGGGTAFAKGAQFVTGSTNQYVELGVSAAARSQGNRVGTARASAVIDFEISVQIVLPNTNDPILSTLIQICRRAGNCDLSVDFLHQTTGRFSYSSFLTRDAGAQFSETLSINNGGSAGIASISGAQQLGGSPITTSVGGAWQLDDFLPGSGAPGETVLMFNHFARINEVRGNFEFASGHPQDSMLATYTAQLSQEAIAGFGNSDYAFGTVAADFAHTSRFSVAGLHDPLSGLDLSGLEMTVSIRELSSVPLPAPLMTLAPALIGLVCTARRRAGARDT